MFICIFIYICRYIYTCTYVCVYMYINIYVYVYTSSENPNLRLQSSKSYGHAVTELSSRTELLSLEIFL